jgi:hypothetical protein
MADVGRILLREMTTPQGPFAKGLGLSHRDSSARPFGDTMPLRLGFDTLVFGAGFALGLRISRLDFFCPLAMALSFRRHASLKAEGHDSLPDRGPAPRYRRKLRRRAGAPVRSTFSR